MTTHLIATVEIEFRIEGTETEAVSRLRQALEQMLMDMSDTQHPHYHLLATPRIG